MKAELLAKSPLLALPLFALFFFIILFVAIFIVTVRRRAAAYDPVARLPLEDDEPRTHDDAVPGARR